MKGLGIKHLLVMLVTVVIAVFVINRVPFLREFVAPPPGK